MRCTNRFKISVNSGVKRTPLIFYAYTYALVIHDRPYGHGKICDAPQDVGEENGFVLVHDPIQDKGHIEDAECCPRKHRHSSGIMKVENLPDLREGHYGSDNACHYSDFVEESDPEVRRGIWFKHFGAAPALLYMVRDDPFHGRNCIR